jgi:hypothetical protein
MAHYAWLEGPAPTCLDDATTFIGRSFCISSMIEALTPPS